MAKNTLRVIGTSVTLPKELQVQARRELGFPISFEVLDGVACHRRGVINPESYDIYDQWFHSLPLLWTAGSVQPIETSLIRRWPQVRPAGDIEASRRGVGTRPGELIYVQPDRSLSPASSEAGHGQIAMLPTAYNVDSFAYLFDSEVGSPQDQPESWAWLLDNFWHGCCSLSLDPASSAVELSLAAGAKGLMKVSDPGNLSIEEIDELFDILMSLKRSGHFGRFWASSEDSVKIMTSTTSSICSMWSPAYYALRGSRHDIAYAVPVEGYRGWHAGLCISAAAKGDMLEMAYAYLNWYLDGTPGTFMTRQGYYMSVTEPLRDRLTAAEWNYWYEGLPATEDLRGSHGAIVVRQGERRKGGSIQERVAKVAAWSTIMPEHNYLARRWREFTGTLGVGTVY